MRYWDASALVPLLVAEPRSAEVSEALAADSGIVTWWGSRIECTSAIARLERASALTPRQASQALAVLATLADGWNEILPGSRRRAARCRQRDGRWAACGRWLHGLRRSPAGCGKPRGFSRRAVTVSRAMP
jgi:uncharacterized protein with PIN domain